MIYSFVPGALLFGNLALIWQMGSMLNILLDSRSIAVSIKFHSLGGSPIHSRIQPIFSVGAIIQAHSF